MCADIIGKKSDLIISKDLNPGIEAVHIYMEPEEIGHMCCRIEPEICFVYIIRGGMRLQINQECRTVREGEGIFINRGRLYRFAGSLNGACEFLFFRIHMEQVIEAELRKRFVDPVLECAEFPYQCLISGDENQKQILDKLRRISECALQNTASLEMRMKGILYEMWSVLYECYEKRETARKMFLRETEKLKRMLIYIHEHYIEKITLAELAEDLGISTGDYCRFFKKHMGQTPFEYLQMYRIEKSIPELLEKASGIGEIAKCHGFNGSSYYAETFHKEMGCNPGEYRKWYLDSGNGSCPLKKVRVGAENDSGEEKERERLKTEKQTMPMHLL